MAVSTNINFTGEQKRAIAGMGLALALRMFGMSLFSLVFTQYAEQFTSSGVFVGIAFGIYGLTQAFLQVPYGMISDKFGRKKVILAGLLIYILGCVMAAEANSILVLILARILQGAGAISGAIYAYIADVVESHKRNRAMAMLSMPFGMAFSIGIIIGPLLASKWGTPFLFWFCAALVAISFFYILIYIKEPPKQPHHKEYELRWFDVGDVMKDKVLSSLNLGGFIANFFQVGFFVIFAKFMSTRGIATNQLWEILLPMVIFGTIIMMWSARKSDSGWTKTMTFFAFCLLGLSGILLLANNFIVIVIGCICFFAGFSMTQPILSAAVTKAAPVEKMGTTSGIYNMSQFIGSFGGGFVAGHFLNNSIPAFLVILSIIGFIGSFLVSRVLTNKVHA